MSSLWNALKDLLHDILFWVHDTGGLSWAWSIIALTAIVRIAIMPLTVKQTRSMLAMQRLQPYIKQLQQKYAKDVPARNQAMVEFYRDNKVNPAASCLPLLVQLPIFFGLFSVLRQFAKTPPKGDGGFEFLFGFVGNITENVNKGGLPAAILLIFYVGSQLFSSKVMMTSTDPRQKMIMYALPIVFVPFILAFPIGLMLYWITTNLWTLVQYVVVVRLTNISGEIIMPADKKGNKKTVTPKADKAKAAIGKTSTGRPATSQREVDGQTVRRNRKKR